MRVPTASQTITYFASLGYLVEQCEADGSRVWKISGPHCPLDGRAFATRLGLWAEWLDYSAECIYEDFLINSLQELWGKANSDGRASLASELAEWGHGRPSPRLSKLLRSAPAWTTDTLPADWKRRIAHIVEGHTPRRPLWLVIKEMSAGSDAARV